MLAACLQASKVRQDAVPGPAASSKVSQDAVPGPAASSKVSHDAVPGPAASSNVSIHAVPWPAASSPHACILARSGYGPDQFTGDCLTSLEAMVAEHGLPLAEHGLPFHYTQAMVAEHGLPLPGLPLRYIPPGISNACRK